MTHLRLVRRVSYRIFLNGRGMGMRACCNGCGWRSEVFGSAGLAGAAWDVHAKHEHHEEAA